MAGGRVRGADVGIDPAAEEARGAVLRGLRAAVAVEGRGDGGDAGKCDAPRAGAGVFSDSGGEGGPGSEASDKGGGQGVGGVLEEDLRGGSCAVREVRRGDEAGGGDPGRRGVGPDSGASRVAGGVSEDEGVT